MHSKKGALFVYVDIEILLFHQIANDKLFNTVYPIDISLVLIDRLNL